MARPRKAKQTEAPPVTEELPLYDHPPAPEAAPEVDPEAHRGAPTNFQGIRRIDN